MKRVPAVCAVLIVLGVLVLSLRAPVPGIDADVATARIVVQPVSVPDPSVGVLDTVMQAPARVSSDEAEVALRALTALVAHAVPNPARCLADSGNGLRDRPFALHRWVDANGITHFSDTPPVGNSRDHRVIEVGGLPPIVVRASGHDVNLPSLLEQRATVDAQAIERVLRETLGAGGEPGFALNIVFVRSPQEYARLVPAPALAESAGAYSSRDRTIHVRWQTDEERAFTIVRHEITHALVHERVGNLPVALNEGLAGFFERIEVSGLGAQVVLRNEQHALRTATTSADGADELVDLLARDAAAFYSEGREVRYLRAFALVATLMARPEGRAALAAVLAAQRADSCVPVDVAGVLDALYPGGLAGLAADWSRWLRDPPATVHAF